MERPTEFDEQSGEEQERTDRWEKDKKDKHAGQEKEKPERTKEWEKQKEGQRG